ncbi:hypothetical protein QF038_001864 [Pseudarthrobacter sp. W1I19]|uniref:hypothetical protein n=1 Tax=Pseudarthrobacter sp. W1I19 TaxID=3042288 RepID=UPI0027811414|nr:hypothetical protein [Pseudarthrobacter sp. W1I19]MDQ0923356.1 hypothetical protein [Pseudarthrobacter sp. W1I19]
MDPTETLRQLRQCIANEPDNTERIIELFEALDTWITRGGFLPAQWSATARGGW